MLAELEEIFANNVKMLPKFQEHHANRNKKSEVRVKILVKLVQSSCELIKANIGYFVHNIALN